MIKLFRITSLLEGLSYLAILSVTLGYISRDYVSSIGMTHGILFMLYMMLAMSNNTGWTSRQQLLLMAAALIPFAFIPTEIFLQKQEQKKPA
ncbi:DUF3817 domain-containing protein [uncultured Neptuniibacter sp.]|uniref:DUF3817 domain-containing protein n=1 Tax=uncultured Neptuniibacter sp. TaxID=502143 RepID=UPI0026094A3F|nr:DUF3817 domain-containing protein [uncultured Neptuniibacter sp.]